MGLAFLYPGQGSQYLTMFQRFATEPVIKPLLDALSQRLKTDVLHMAESMSNEQLHENRTAQLLMVGHSLAVSRLLAEEGLEPIVHAGYSVGELSAHACAGAIDPIIALDLALVRADCMDKAASSAGEGHAMIALRGLNIAAVQALANKTSTEIALINGPEHMVLAGLSSAVAAVEEQAARQGARTIKRLDVRVASHTSFLSAAVPDFQAMLQTISWQSPNVPVLSGIDGRLVRTREEFQTVLPMQLHKSVNWLQCMESAVERSATIFLEVGPGRSLTKMVDEMYPYYAARAVDDFRSMKGVANWVHRQLENR